MTKRNFMKKQILMNEFKSFVLIVFAVFSFRSVAFDHYRVPSGSMIPTLNIGDQIVVNKMAYGLQLPFAEYFGKPIMLFAFNTPKKGEVIVFKHPAGGEINLVKRVIAASGDVVMMRNKQLYINGVAKNRIPKDGFDLKADMVKKFQEIDFNFFTTKTGETKHIIQHTQKRLAMDDFGPIQVPADKVFVMGDNRDFSGDSRVFGFVSNDLIMGQAQAIWVSLSLPFSGGEFKFRPHRSGNII